MSLVEWALLAVFAAFCILIVVASNGPDDTRYP